MAKRGVFAGMAVVDLIYRVPEAPRANRKYATAPPIVCAGGPAANAAIAFAHLGGEATLAAPAGRHALASLIRDDLERYGVTFLDLAADYGEPPPVASIVVTEPTGERMVVSPTTRIAKERVAPLAWSAIDGADIFMADGHYLDAIVDAAEQARRGGVVTVLDGGSWKPGLERLLRHIDIAICSEDFAADPRQYGVPLAAVTHGSGPIDAGEVQIPVRRIEAVDTLGAGDIFHGAFCRAYQGDFEAALRYAAEIATRSCEFAGPRAWMHAPPETAPRSS